MWVEHDRPYGELYGYRRCIHQVDPWDEQTSVVCGSVWVTPWISDLGASQAVRTERDGLSRSVSEALTERECRTKSLLVRAAQA